MCRVTQAQLRIHVAAHDDKFRCVMCTLVTIVVRYTLGLSRSGFLIQTQFYFGRGGGDKKYYLVQRILCSRCITAGAETQIDLHLVSTNDRFRKYKAGPVPKQGKRRGVCLTLEN